MAPLPPVFARVTSSGQTTATLLGEDVALPLPLGASAGGTLPYGPSAANLDASELTMALADSGLKHAKTTASTLTVSVASDG